MSAISRVLIVLLLCIVVPVHVWAATAHVKNQSNRKTTAGHTTHDLVVTGGMTNTGDTAVGSLNWRPTTSALTSVTVCGNVATLYDNPTTQGTTQETANFVYSNVSSGACTITATFDANVTDSRIIVHEVSGTPTTTPEDQHACNPQTNPGTGTDAITSGAVITTSNGQYIYGATYANGGVASTPGTGFTQGENTTTQESEYLIQTSAGSIAATFTGANGNWITCIVTLKDASAGGGGSVSSSTHLLMGVGR